MIVALHLTTAPDVAPVVAPAERVLRAADAEHALLVVCPAHVLDEILARRFAEEQAHEHARAAADIATIQMMMDRLGLTAADLSAQTGSAPAGADFRVVDCGAITGVSASPLPRAMTCSPASAGLALRSVVQARFQCVDASASQCPHLTRTAATAVIIARGQQQRHGQVAPEIGLTEDWPLRVGLF